MARRRTRLPGAMNWLQPASQNRSTTIMFQGFSTLTASASGNGFFAIPFDPSSSGYNFAEWSDVAALWNEVRLVAVQIQVTGFNIETSGTALYIGYRWDLNSAPSSVSSVTQLSSCLAYNFMRDASVRGFRMTARAPMPLNFSDTSSVSTAPYAGCPGSFQIAGTNFPDSQPIAAVRVRAIYYLRGRF